MNEEIGPYFTITTTLVFSQQISQVLILEFLPSKTVSKKCLFFEIYLLYGFWYSSLNRVRHIYSKSKKQFLKGLQRSVTIKIDMKRK